MKPPDTHRLSTDLVRVTLLNSAGRKTTLWAKPLPSKQPGRRVFLKVDEEGNTPSSFNAATNTVTETKCLYIASDADVVSERPAFMSLKYGTLET
jgi:hypothetical protein